MFALCCFLFSDSVQAAFNLCDPLRSMNDVNQLFGWARNAFVIMAMADYPYATSFLSPLPAWPVKVPILVVHIPFPVSHSIRDFCRLRANSWQLIRIL